MTVKVAMASRHVNLRSIFRPVSLFSSCLHSTIVCGISAGAMCRPLNCRPEIPITISATFRQMACLVM